MAFNPIPFNHDNMTLSQVKKCVETLGMIFDGMEREVPVENIMFHANEARKQMLNQWSINDD